MLSRRDFLASAALVTALGVAGVGAEALAESEPTSPAIYWPHATLEPGWYSYTAEVELPNGERRYYSCGFAISECQSVTFRPFTIGPGDYTLRRPTLVRLA